MLSRKRRGPYKEYLRNPDLDIPESTLKRRKLLEEISENECDTSNSFQSQNSEPSDSVYDTSILNNHSCTNEPHDTNSEVSEASIKDDVLSEIDNFVDDGDDNFDNIYEDFCDNFVCNEVIKEKERLPLYDGCDLSRAESELIILSLSLRHSFSNAALEHVVKTIDLHLPHVEYKSKYLFLKSFNEPECLEYYYCASCPANLEFQGTSNVTQCEFCETTCQKDQLRKDGHFFYYLPLKEQFMELVKSPIYKKFRRVCDERDIVNGSVYKDLVNRNIIGENDFTIQWNVDGVSLFKSSKIGITPIIITVNELPYRERKNNPILAGLFYGNSPPMNVYLKPLSKEMKELGKCGFRSSTYQSLEIITIKVHTIASPIDSVERPKVQNVRQFNGRCGCSYCYHKGETVKIGRGWTRVYSGNEGVARSHEKHKEDIINSINSNEIVNSVKGASIVMSIPNFDIIHGFPPEYMHSCLLGVCKLFATEWFDSKNHDKAWYIGLKVNEFNERLLSIKPPTEITRVPRPVTESYKASEWKNFILYYSVPSLHGVLPKKYLKHWLLLVYSMNTFLQRKIDDESFTSAEKALYEFVNKIEILYGKELMKYNVHLLFHLPSYIKKYGALWAWSAFPYENFNGVMQHLFHGTQSISLQICKSYNKLRNIRNMAEIFNDPRCSEDGKALFISLMNECRVQRCIEYGASLRIFGTPRVVRLSLNSKVVIEQLVEHEVPDTCHSYDRFIFKSSLIHTSNYKKLKKRINSTILTEDENLVNISDILVIEKLDSNDKRYVLLGTQLTILDEQICRHRGISTNLFSFVAQESNSICCIDVSSIKHKCLVMPYKNGKLYVVPLANVLETD